MVGSPCCDIGYQTPLLPESPLHLRSNPEPDGPHLMRIGVRWRWPLVLGFRLELCFVAVHFGKHL